MPLRSKISLIIVNFNNSTDTLDCLESIQKQKKDNLSLETIIVDNASTDDSFNQIKTKYPKNIVYKLPQNLGFAGGINHGIKIALETNPDYIMLLNNDSLITESDFFNKLLEKTADITAPLIKFTLNGKTTTDYGGKVDYLFARNTHQYHQGEFDYLSGVCLLIKPTVFQKIGFFNSRFFLYYEDADFCLRAKRAGLSLLINNKASVFHKLSASTNKLGKKKLQVLAQSQLIFAKKHLPIRSLPFYYFYHLYLRIKSL
jgi:GT2 family glycosyltransferase